jgi:hypothetical protein
MLFYSSCIADLLRIYLITSHAMCIAAWGLGSGITGCLKTQSHILAELGS